MLTSEGATPVTGFTGARLRALRTAVGMSQVELARRLHFSKAAISAWERPPERGGRGVPRLYWRPVFEVLRAERDRLAALLAQWNELRERLGLV